MGKVSTWVRDTINDIKIKNARRKMIEDVAEQKVRAKGTFGMPMEEKLKEKYKIANDLKKKMKVKGVY